MYKNMSIEENFLSKEEHKLILKTLTSPEFPWFYSDSQVDGIDSNSYFFHVFYAENKINSHLFPIIKPLFDKIGVSAIVNARANMLVNKNKQVSSAWHCDFSFYPNKAMHTGIYYVNTNNGFTEFENNTITLSKENSFIEFNHLTKHRAISQTDTDIRIVINLNYYKEE